MGIKTLATLGLAPLLSLLILEPYFYDAFLYKTEEHNTPFHDRDFKNVEHIPDEPMKPVSKDDKAMFKRDGYVILQDMFDKDLVAKMRSVANHTRDNPTIYNKYFTYAFKEMYLQHRSDFFRDMTYFSPVPRIAQAFMQEDTTAVFHVVDGLWSKVPGKAAKVNQGDDTNWTLTFHSDRKEVPTDAKECVNIWLALTYISENDAPLLVIPKSHATPISEKKRLLKEPEDLIGQYKPMAPLNPGDIVVVNCHTLHGSASLGKDSPGRMAFSWFMVGETKKHKTRFTDQAVTFGKYVQHYFWQGPVEQFTNLEDTDCYTRTIPTRLPHQMQAQASRKCNPNVYRLPVYIYGFIKNIYFYLFTDAMEQLE